MWEKEQWIVIMESDVSSDNSGSWISIEGSTQVSPLILNPEGDKFAEVYWPKQDISLNFVV